MNDYNTQEKIGFLSRMGVTFLKLLSIIGLLIAIAGLFICFTGVGAIAGVPLMAIGLLVGRLGLSIWKDGSNAATKRGGCLIKFLGLLFILIIIQAVVPLVIFIWHSKFR